ncbi:hypothetical protein EIN_062450 [Entamoeba invadens IP1]|uniref:hypothetical protein n=1 Tax=Entamoeba invadens IP1 TaxID=370355 RepID=UPI0002C3EC91|nr:hypothetical protein EIN_062450 [Entamoeba invadens IP1]ELP93570.1 hypothetical protein EIN_062450 [Entamoeba invadens IP1]|eukprot:XP_004260341.1 hypothetical protein EIN_062450 [Entamoeba invadens IP1]
MSDENKDLIATPIIHSVPDESNIVLSPIELSPRQGSQEKDVDENTLISVDKNSDNPDKKLCPQSNETTKFRQNHIFSTVSLLRAICGVVAVFYNLTLLFSTPDYKYFPYGFLAADFFFLLSGFLAAHSNRDCRDIFIIEKIQWLCRLPFQFLFATLYWAYKKLILCQWSKKNIESIGEQIKEDKRPVFNPFTYLIRRIFRILPIQVFATFFCGTWYILLNPKANYEAFQFLLFIGSLSIPSKKDKLMFPLNPIASNLLYGHLGNFIYAFALRHLHIIFIMLIDVYCGSTIIAFTQNKFIFSECANLSKNYTLNWGMANDKCNMNVGILRVTFGFVQGIVVEFFVRNLVDLWEQKIGKFPRVWGYVCSFIGVCVSVSGLLMIFMHVPVKMVSSLSGQFQAFALIVIFPVVLALAALCEIPTNFLRRGMKEIGDVTFAVCMLHSFYVTQLANYIKNNKRVDVRVFKWNFFATCAEALFVGIAAAKILELPLRYFLNETYLEERREKKVD